MDSRARTNPFPGLRPFMQEEADLFFGRDKQSDELVRRLAGRRFLAVVGTSGSGKSSLVRAGLLPSLEGGFMAEAGAHWRMAILRPQDDPHRVSGAGHRRNRRAGASRPCPICGGGRGRDDACGVAAWAWSRPPASPGWSRMRIC